LFRRTATLKVKKTQHLLYNINIPAEKAEKKRAMKKKAVEMFVDSEKS
jgi:hypothetical protein